VGERQRVALGAVLAGEPEVLLLDEPTRGMDLEQKATLARFLRRWVEGGRTALIATHDVEWVAQCADRVVLMGEGQAVAEGPPREVMGGSLAFATQMAKLFGDPRLLTVEDVLQALGRARP
jgi:energy-coupling factor transport system ATP-binding protein